MVSRFFVGRGELAEVDSDGDAGHVKKPTPMVCAIRDTMHFFPAFCDGGFRKDGVPILPKPGGHGGGRHIPMRIRSRSITEPIVSVETIPRL